MSHLALTVIFPNRTTKVCLSAHRYDEYAITSYTVSDFNIIRIICLCGREEVTYNYFNWVSCLVVKVNIMPSKAESYNRI